MLNAPAVSLCAEEVQLVAVSKFQSKEAILEAYAAGQRVFGENYVQVSEYMRASLRVRASLCARVSR